MLGAFGCYHHGAVAPIGQVAQAGGDIGARRGGRLRTPHAGARTPPRSTFVLSAEKE